MNEAELKSLHNRAYCMTRFGELPLNDKFSDAFVFQRVMERVPGQGDTEALNAIIAGWTEGREAGLLP